MMNHSRLSVYTGAKAWDTIWKWTWFTREQWLSDFRMRKEGTRRALSSLLPELGAQTVLDCSCGLGWKTILLAEMGYEVEGSDASRVAVEHAQELAEAQGLVIRFFRSRWESLEHAAGREYDCVYSDAFQWITRRRSLVEVASGIHSVLERGGKFVFHGAHEWSRDSDNARKAKEDFEREGAFELLPFYERDGLRLTTIVARELTSDGYLGSRIHVIDDRGTVRVEVARILDLYKWTWSDYVEALRTAGFREFYSVKERGVGPEDYILNVALK